MIPWVHILDIQVRVAFQEVCEDLAVACVHCAVEGRVTSQIREVQARGVVGQEDLIGEVGRQMDGRTCVSQPPLTQL